MDEFSGTGAGVIILRAIRCPTIPTIGQIDRENIQEKTGALSPNPEEIRDKRIVGIIQPCRAQYVVSNTRRIWN